MPETMDARKDWVSGPASHMLAWGLPIAALVAAIWTDHPVKTLVWTGALLWMGIACVANAVRCGRTHCYFTGPFYLALAVASILHGYEVLWLGPRGWMWLGITVAAGSAILWCLSESVWGRYRPSRNG